MCWITGFCPRLLSPATCLPLSPSIPSLVSNLEADVRENTQHKLEKAISKLFVSQAQNTGKDWKTTKKVCPHILQASEQICFALPVWYKCISHWVSHFISQIAPMSFLWRRAQERMEETINKSHFSNGGCDLETWLECHNIVSI